MFDSLSLCLFWRRHLFDRLFEKTRDSFQILFNFSFKKMNPMPLLLFFIHQHDVSWLDKWLFIDNFKITLVLGKMKIRIVLCKSLIICVQRVIQFNNWWLIQTKKALYFIYLVVLAHLFIIQNFAFHIFLMMIW